MNKIIATLLLIICISLKKSYSQSVSINIDGTQADTSAILDVKSTSKGILIPRVNLINNDTPINGVKPIGLLVWNVNDSFQNGQGYYFWTGTLWKSLFQPYNLINNDGIVPAPTLQNRNTTWSTDNNANPSWKRINKTMEYINNF